MTKFKRWIIRRTIRATAQQPAEVLYVSIGKGYIADITEAHLYTRLDLAQKNMERDRKSTIGWCSHVGRKADFDIIEVDVTVGNVVK